MIVAARFVEDDFHAGCGGIACGPHPAVTTDPHPADFCQLVCRPSQNFRLDASILRQIFHKNQSAL
jgi:hypothetical protein